MRSCHAVLLFVSLLLIFSTGNAQNLVLNPSFETVNTANLQCSWYTSQGQFNNAISNWTCPTGGSTDIYHTSLATSCFCSPQSTNGSAVGTQNPRTGNAYVNLVTYGNGGCTPYREYVQGTLSSPLVVGQTYKVEMYVTLADYSNKGTNNIGVKFTTAPVSTTSMCVYSAVPDVNYIGPIIVDKTNWTLISLCFTPTVSGLQYLMIGNFYSDAATSIVNTGGSQTTIRYFLDDVSVTPVSTANAGTNGTLSTCAGASTVDLFTLLGGNPDTGGTWTGPSSLGGGYLGTFDPAVNTPGTYTYSVGGVVCGNTSTSTSSVTVTFNANNTAMINQAGPYCESAAAVQLSANTSGGTWSASCGSCISPAGVFDPAVAGQGTHQVSYTLPGLCGSTDTETITITSALDASITPVSAICESSASLTLNSADPGGSWSASCASCISASGVFDPAVSGTGTHIIYYSIPGACGDSDSLVIQVLPQADASIDPASMLCSSGSPVTLSAAQSGGTWAATCGSCISVSGTFDPVTAGPGTHTVSYSLAGQCGSTDTEIITVQQQRDATINNVSSYCSSDSPFIITSVESGGIWTSSCGSCIDNNGTFTPSTAGPGNHWVVYEITGSCGDIDSLQVQILPLPDPTITTINPLCLSDSPVTLSATDPGGQWNGSCSGCIDPSTGVFDPAIAGVGTHSVTYTIGGQCSVSDILQISVSAALDASITSVSGMCVNDPPLTLNAADPGGSWSASCTNCITANGVFNPSAAGAGTHTVTYAINSSCGDTSSIQIIVNPPVSAEITPVSDLCPNGNPVTLSSVTPGGTWSGAGITDPVAGIFNPVAAGPGSHLIYYTISGNCGNSDSIPVIVNPSVQLADPTDLQICEGTSTSVIAAASSGTGTYSYTWTDQSGGILSNTAILSVTPAISETYMVSVTDQCGTSSMQDVFILVTNLPDATFTASATEGCLPLTVTFLSTNNYSGTCNWNFGNGGSSTDCNTTSYTFVESGCFDISYSVDISGCRDTVTIADLVCVHPAPIADFVASPARTTVLEPTINFINQSIHANTYTWDLGDGSTTGTEHVTHLYDGIPGTYQVCLEASAYGCIDTACTNIIIEDEFIVYVPNAFTPDNNGRNDVFMPVLSGHSTDNYDFVIYNRWGNEVFRSKDPLSGWQGKNVQEDVYVWMLTVTSAADKKLHKLKGTVTIVR